MPSWYGSPSTAHMRSLNKVGTPRNGPSGSAAAATSSRAWSKRGWMTALSSGLSFSMRLIAASTSSTGDSCPLRTSSAWAVASSSARSSVMARTLRPHGACGPASRFGLAPPPAQQRDRDVVAQAAGRKRRDVVDATFDDRLGLVVRRRAHEVGEPLYPEFVARRVADLGEPVGVYDELVAVVEPGRRALPRADERPDDRSGGPELDGVAGRAHQRRWMPSAGVGDLAGAEVDNGDECGQEGLVAEVVQLLRSPQHGLVGRERVPEPGPQQLLAAQRQDPRDRAVPGDVDD